MELTVPIKVELNEKHIREIQEKAFLKGKLYAFRDCKLENGEYCWQECCATEHCLECAWLGNGDICYFDNTFVTHDLSYADMPTTP